MRPASRLTPVLTPVDDNDDAPDAYDLGMEGAPDVPPAITEARLDPTAKRRDLLIACAFLACGFASLAAIIVQYQRDVDGGSAVFGVPILLGYACALVLSVVFPDRWMYTAFSVPAPLTLALIVALLVQSDTDAAMSLLVAPILWTSGLVALVPAALAAAVGRVIRGLILRGKSGHVGGPSSSMGDVTDKPEPVTFRQARWWSPLRVVIALTAAMWIPVLGFSTVGAIQAIGEPPSGNFEGGAYTTFAVSYLFVGFLYALPLTVLVWLAGLPFIIARMMRRHSLTSM